MKKFLVMLLACAMIFGFASTAFAADTQVEEFSDIADQSKAAQTAIMKLAVLGVVEGNDGLGGPFRPTENLTRAEFAKIVCYLTGNVKMADSLATVGSRFTDVSTGNWYTGWVNAAAQSGYYVGDPGGTFRPNANITMQEVVTVVLRAAGYSDRLPGAWPGNYVTKATNVGLLDDVTFVGSAAATRADMAIICNEVLGINMVEYIDNDIAAGIGRTSGTVDRDGYAEVHYVSNETDGEEKETILHKAFKGEYHNIQLATAVVAKIVDEDDEEVSEIEVNFDEVSGWGYEDFDGGEISLRAERAFTSNSFKTAVSGGYGDAEDLASSYYITGGFVLPELAGMQAEIIVIDGDEICFVDVYSSYEKVSSIYLDSGRVMAGGKSYRPSETMGVSNNVNNIVDYTEGVDVQNLHSSNSDNDFGGKVYFDKDGRVYATKNYNAYNDTPFGIFDKIDSSIADWKNAFTSSAKLEVNKDYLIYKDGEFIKAEDLNENDLVSYLGDSLGVKFYVVNISQEGELSNQTNTKLTLAGTGYRIVDGFLYSDDGGDTFNTFNLKSDEADFGEAEYALAYNFNNLGYVVANTSSNKIIGVVTEITPTQVWDATAGTRLDQYQEITIFNAEGKEVTYKFTSDFRDGYNWKVEDLTTRPFKHGSANVDKWNSVNNGTSMLEQVGGSGIIAGDIVQLSVNGSDQVKKLVNYAAFEAKQANEQTVKVQSSNSRITFKEGSFTLNKDAAIFNVSPDGEDYDDVAIGTAASTLAADFDALKIVAFDKKSSGEIMALYVIGDISQYQFGIVTGQGRDSTGTYYTVNDKRVYSDGAPADAPSVIAYTVSGGEATIAGYLTEGSGEGSYYVNTVDDLKDSSNSGKSIADYVRIMSGGNWFAAVGHVPANGYSSGTGLLNVGGTSVFIETNTYMYDIVGDDTCDAVDFRDNYVVAVYDKDGDALFVALVDGAPDTRSTDASVNSIVVKDIPATLDSGTTYKVELPFGTDLDADVAVANVVVTKHDSKATVGTPVKADNGAKWTVEVTAENGTKVVYTINVTVGPQKFAVTAPAAITAAVNGLTATAAVTPAGPYTAGTAVTVTVTVTGIASGGSTTTVALTGSSAGTITDPASVTYIEGMDTGDKTFVFTFVMPTTDVNDLAISLT